MPAITAVSPATRYTLHQRLVDNYTVNSATDTFVVRSALPYISRSLKRGIAHADSTSDVKTVESKSIENYTARSIDVERYFAGIAKIFSHLTINAICCLRHNPKMILKAVRQTGTRPARRNHLMTRRSVRFTSILILSAHKIR